ncbi:SDR family NAD(P)-dependent oxidoreductase [Paenarthrobacter sp. NPDC056912]|uniref:SDR family NAD(P)-dependent oxidoreductase n=1 Tax=Paenarthrobacter sp. NPDC056912 TaxID=3345965 RepID=UPI00366FF724
MTDPTQRPVVLITGAGGAIGRSTAQRFLTGGYRVALADIDITTAEMTVKELGADARSAYGLELDVTSEDSIVRALDNLMNRWGRLDAAHNNAGITTSGPLTHTYEKAAFDLTLNVDLVGVWLCMKHEIAAMLEQGHGAIINTASIAAHIGYKEASAYAAAKHGVLGLTRTAAVEYGGMGLRVNAVSPGPVQTPMLEASFARRPPGTKEWYLDNTPMRRFATSMEIANAVFWLASTEASFVNGHCLAVDGGWTAK